MNNKGFSEERRVFMKKAAFIIGSGALFPIIPSLITSCQQTESPTGTGGGSATANISDMPELANIGGAAKRSFSGKNNDMPVIIIKTAQDQFLSLSSTCTHQGCEVNLPAEGSSIIECPCHGSQYSKQDGSVVRGPASRRLQRFDNTFDSTSKILTIYF
jgi:Rieske Fe-S protein